MNDMVEINLNIIKPYITEQYESIYTINSNYFPQSKKNKLEELSKSSTNEIVNKQETSKNNSIEINNWERYGNITTSILAILILIIYLFRLFVKKSKTQGGYMGIVDRVKWDGTPDILAYKYPITELSTWTQLIVNESQEAFLVRGGVYEGPFGAGRHTLSTENIPIIRKIMGYPFGGKSPFSAEIWFVNKQINLDILWGTTDPIQLEDPKYHVMLPVRAFGQYGIEVTDTKRFLLKLVGTLSDFTTEKLSEYFRGIFITRIKNEIAISIQTLEISILEVSTRLDTISNTIKILLNNELEEYGVVLKQFNIHSINVPENDPAVLSLKTALAKRAEMGIIGFNYQQERSFDVMQTAAGNEGTAGGVMGAGVGLGIGLGIGTPLAVNFGQLGNNITLESNPNEKYENYKHEEKIKILKDLSDMRKDGILTEEEFEIEKKKILNN